MAKRRMKRSKRGGLRGRRRRTRRGLRGPLKSGMMRDLVPGGLGVMLPLGVTLGVRAFVDPVPGQTSSQVFRWAPLIGLGAGVVLGGAASYVLGDKKTAITTAVHSVIVGGMLYGLDRVMVDKPTSYAALAPAGTQGYRRGVGAIVPEYGTQGLRAVVMERLNGGRRQLGQARNAQGQGAVVELRGSMQPGAFGSQQYG